MPEAVLLDVHEPRHRPLVEEAVGRGDEAERGRDDLVTLADPEGTHAHVEPGGAAGAGDPFAAADERRDARFEPRGERAQREHVAGEDLGHELEFTGADVRPGEGDTADRSAGVMRREDTDNTSGCRGSEPARVTCWCAASTAHVAAAVTRLRPPTRCPVWCLAARLDGRGSSGRLGLHSRRDGDGGRVRRRGRAREAGREGDLGVDPGSSRTPLLPSTCATVAEQDPDVKGEAPVLDVPGIQLEAILERQRVAPTHRGPAGDAGAHLVTTPLTVRVVREVLDEERPRAHEAHVATQDVPQLRELIDARRAEEAPEPRDAVLVRQVPDFTGARQRASS